MYRRDAFRKWNVVWGAFLAQRHHHFMRLSTPERNWLRKKKRKKKQPSSSSFEKEKDIYIHGYIKVIIIKKREWLFVGRQRRCHHHLATCHWRSVGKLLPLEKERRLRFVDVTSGLSVDVGPGVKPDLFSQVEAVATATAPRRDFFHFFLHLIF